MPTFEKQWRRRLRPQEISIRTARIDEWDLYEYLEDEFGAKKFKLEVSKDWQYLGKDSEETDFISDDHQLVPNMGPKAFE